MISGWYNEREETFVTENDAKLSNYLDPVSRKSHLQPNHIYLYNEGIVIRNPVSCMA